MEPNMYHQLYIEKQRLFNHNIALTVKKGNVEDAYINLRREHLELQQKYAAMEELCKQAIQGGRQYEKLFYEKLDLELELSLEILNLKETIKTLSKHLVAAVIQNNLE